MTETEIQIRLASVRVGVWLTVIVSLGYIGYCLWTWDEENRAAILALSAAGLLSAPLAAMLPIERIVRSPRREVFFVSWSLLYIVLICAGAALDGGARSPFVLFMFLPFLFAALTYPRRWVAFVGVFAIAAFVGLAILAGGGMTYSVFGAFALFCVALQGAWDASNKLARSRELSNTAEALRDSEATSRKQASQQHEVAEFGRLALSGEPIDALQQRAVDLVKRVLRVDICAVMRRRTDDGDFAAIAQVGLPEEIAFTAPVRGSSDSQSGYTVATGAPVIVEDWLTEKRFKQSEALKDQGMRTGVSVPINVEGEPWGLLGGQSREKRTVTAEDVSFMQAVANVLAYAIERANAEERTRHEALHDPLTGLPNRSLFRDRLEQALLHARRDGGRLAVLFLDLDQFKLVNDSLGHAAGDELLAAVAPRLEQTLRPGDTVARFGGDEFAVLADGIENERDAIRVAEHISEAFTRPVVLRQREHFASASIGISIADGHEDPEALIRDADAALYRAKERGRGGYEIFDDAMRSRVIDHVQTENDLRRALQRRELELHYQPIVALSDGSIAMFEALIRWNHPERGLLPPAAFIPVAEESRLIVPVGHWVIEEACRQAAAWQAQEPDSAPIGVAVNIAAAQLADAELALRVRNALTVNDLDPSSLRLELTETTLLDEAETPRIGLDALKSLGVRLVLDDFGTGFSSLGYLKRLPLAGIKLDRTFIESVTEGDEDATIVRAMTEMATALGLEVCAEGVETEEQLAAVRELGCSHAQGVLFAKPMPAQQIRSAGLDSRSTRIPNHER